jgi:outer membrane immunogenic protein
MKINRILLAGVAGVMSIPAAQAADMALKAPPMVAAPSWAGWYIGGNAGVASVEINRYDPDGSLDDLSGRNTSFIGGGQVGYNWQSGTLVYGLEADGSFLGSKQNFDGEGSNRLPWLVTARLRMGLAVGDTMAYVTGGVAFGEIKTTNENFGGYSQSKTRVGWTIGGGVEHMINRNWTIALEGLFVDLGSKTYCSKDCSLRKVTGQAAIGRLKINYKF